MEVDVQHLSETAEKVGDKLRTTVGSTVGRNTVFREDMEDEQFG
jgi:hypothetical protein